MNHKKKCYLPKAIYDNNKKMETENDYDNKIRKNIMPIIQIVTQYIKPNIIHGYKYNNNIIPKYNNKQN